MEKAFNWRQFRRLFAYMKPYRKQLLPVIIVMTVLGTLTKLAIPFLISLTIDRALLGKSGRLLVIYAIVMFAMYTVQWVATGYRMRYTNVIGQQVVHDLRFHLFRHIQQLSFRFFDKRPAGSILVRVTNDVNALQDLFTNGVVNLMIDCVQLVGIVAILLFLNAKLALAIMITVPLMFVVSHSLQRRIRIAWQEVRTRQSRINAHLNESIQGIRVTQAFVQEQNNMRYFADMNASNKTRWDKAQTLNVSFGPIIEMTAAVGTFILFWYGSHLVATGAVTIGFLVAFANYIGNFWEPINRLGAMYAQLLVAMASSERIFEFLDERPHVEEKPDAIDLPPIRGDIRFERVGFEYEAGRKALTEVSLEAKPGQSIAFVGHTGSGKSTIVNLLCRFYDATSG
ncbi:MAG: ABC transporter ATP-binding protein, partial [Paenibacillaceae bacterium]|nr:ABC transporter ATP-binding protein [Paenibacillaceae bacterium]